jgi:hypothetical protein
LLPIDSVTAAQNHLIGKSEHAPDYCRSRPDPRQHRRSGEANSGCSAREREYSSSNSASVHQSGITIHHIATSRGGNMTPHFEHEHIRMMELRIEQQSALIERLTRSGQDVSQASQRLTLLHHALDEMRIQLDQLSQTSMDAKRPNGAALSIVSGAIKHG